MPLEWFVILNGVKNPRISSGHPKRRTTKSRTRTRLH
jgi:hypothetical protein